MALFQIRRGSSSSKGTLAYGEPYLNSDSQSVVFGVDSNEEITLVKLKRTRIKLNDSLIGCDTEIKGETRTLNIGDNTEIDLG